VLLFHSVSPLWSCRFVTPKRPCLFSRQGRWSWPCHSRLASRKYARIVQKLGFDAKFSESEHCWQCNLGCDVKFPIRLEGLAYSHGQFSSYAQPSSYWQYHEHAGEWNVGDIESECRGWAEC
jgi:hypothetical protein